MKFSTRYQSYREEIRATARRQFVPGLDYDDVVSEMSICLWRAHESWDETTGTSFGSYWWSLWLNRRTDLTRESNALKRPKTEPVEDPDKKGSYRVIRFPDPPRHATKQDRLIWELLGAGETAGSIINMLKISRRRYYRTVKGWHSEDVYSYLKNP